MMTQEAPAVWKCRYRYATGCTVEWPPGKKQSMYAHEKVTAAHALHRITLTACPVCGNDYGGELGRATHLAAEHGVTAGSERRQDLDARQVKELYDEQHAPELPEPFVAAVPALNGSAPNGHSPASRPQLDVAALEDWFTTFREEVVAVRTENAALRAAVADLEPDAARYRQIKAVLGQD